MAICRIIAEVMPMNNSVIAEWLRRHARELEAKGGNLLRVRAYRRAAQTICELDEPLLTLWHRDGRRGLLSIPSIGRHIALAIDSLIRTGEMPPHRPISAA